MNQGRIPERKSQENLFRDVNHVVRRKYVNCFDKCIRFNLKRICGKKRGKYRTNIISYKKIFR